MGGHRGTRALGWQDIALMGLPYWAERENSRVHVAF